MPRRDGPADRPLAAGEAHPARHCPAGQGPEEARLLAQYAALALGDAGSWTAGPAGAAAGPARLVGGQAARTRRVRRAGRRDPPRRPSRARCCTWSPPTPKRAHRLPQPAAGAAARRGRGPVRRLAHGHPGQPHPHLPAQPQPAPDYPRRPPVGPAHGRAARTPGREPGAARCRLLLTYVEADREQALAIAEWLEDKGISVELLARRPDPRASAVGGQGRAPLDPCRTAFWAERPVEQARGRAGGLLLRTEDVDLPAAGAGPGQVLDWQDWSAWTTPPRPSGLLRSLQRWRDGAQVEHPSRSPGPGPGRERPGRRSTAMRSPPCSRRSMTRAPSPRAGWNRRPARRAGRPAPRGRCRRDRSAAEKSLARLAPSSRDFLPRFSVCWTRSTTRPPSPHGAWRSATSWSAGRPAPRGRSRRERPAGHRLGGDPRRTLYLPGRRDAGAADLLDRPLPGHQSAVSGLHRRRRILHAWHAQAGAPGAREAERAAR